jgi:hypothetical protein
MVRTEPAPSGYRGNGISDGQGGDGRQHDKALHGVPPVFKNGVIVWGRV